jgi:tRNA pseudouridine38-40 synthase
MTQEGSAAESRNIRLVLTYDGTPYHGWQVQPQGPTVQSVLQEALGRVTGEKVSVKGAGRTDAGVHALGQAANFRTRSRLDPGTFVRALNSVLPPTIAILSADEVAADFDAQYSAAGKLYRYRVFNNRIRSPFERRHSWHINRLLNIDAMKSVMPLLIGNIDFSSFRAHGCVASSPVRKMTKCDISIEGDFLLFELEADGFLRHMVRNIVGTLVDVGRGRFSASDFSAILASKDRTAAGVSAPPQLVGVKAPPYLPTTADTASIVGAPVPLGRTRARRGKRWKAALMNRRLWKPTIINNNERLPLTNSDTATKINALIRAEDVGA